MQVDLIGRKARDWFRRRPYATRRVTVDLFRNVTLEQAREVASTLMRDFVAAGTDAVQIVYNQFRAVIQQRVVVEPLLPIPRGLFGGAVQEDGQAVPMGAAEDYIYEPGDAQLFEVLLPRHVEIQIFRALLESAAAEYGARMTAMENATRNADEMIETLTLQMNKIRQASITKEILEVVSGAEALR